MDDRVQKNEYFEKKEQKEQAERSKAAGKRLKRFLIWTVVLGIAALISWWGYNLIREPVGPLPGEFFAAQSRDHIAPGSSHEDYNSNPPTGGWHYAQPAQTGIYDKELTDEQLIHNLEHSHIWISYKPDLAKDQINKLANIAESYGSRIIVTMRTKNDSPIAVAAWQYLLKLDTIDKDQIRDFIRAHRNLAGPERNVPDFGFKDFRAK